MENKTAEKLIACLGCPCRVFSHKGDGRAVMAAYREARGRGAREQYAWCPDIVDQGCESVGVLADTLAQSTVWFFWWD